MRRLLSIFLNTLWQLFHISLKLFFMNLLRVKSPPPPRLVRVSFPKPVLKSYPKQVMFCDLSSNHSMKRTRLTSIGVLKPCSWDFSNMHSFDFLACFFFFSFLAHGFLFPYLSDSSKATPTLSSTSVHTYAPPTTTPTPLFCLTVSVEKVSDSNSR